MDEINWLFEQQRFGIKPGLSRVERLLARCGAPHERFKSVLITGTNGKGSTAAVTAGILTAAGIRTGLFTSPHLSYFNERFQLNMTPLNEHLIRDTITQLKPVAEQEGATFFEILTVLACLLFAKQNVDIAVMEVGMGGRYDATNVLTPIASVITSVGLDHTAILGDSVSAIALDKAGIMRPNVPAYTAAQDEALSVIKQEAARTGSPLHVMNETMHVTSHAPTWNGSDLHVQLAHTSYDLHTPLIGKHQHNNVALAVAVANQLKLSTNAIQTGVRTTRWPGRLELLSYRERRVLLDGAHNPAAAQALVETLVALNAGHLTVILGVSADKDVAGIWQQLAPVVGALVVTQAQLNPRALAPEALREHTRADAMVTHSLPEALACALDMTAKNDVILVVGSLYLIGEMRPLLLGEAGETRERWQ